MASSSIPPMPGAGSQSSGDPSSLMGDGQSSGPQGAAGAQSPDFVRSTLEQFRDMDSKIMALVQQFPDAAAEGRAASQAMKSMASKILTNSKTQEPPNPRVLG